MFVVSSGELAWTLRNRAQSHVAVNFKCIFKYARSSEEVRKPQDHMSPSGKPWHSRNILSWFPCPIQCSRVLATSLSFEYMDRRPASKVRLSTNTYHPSSYPECKSCEANRTLARCVSVISFVDGCDMFIVEEGEFVLQEAVVRVSLLVRQGRRDEIAEVSAFWAKGTGGLSGRKPGLWHQRRWHDLRITHLTLCARVADFHATLNLSAPDSTLLAVPQWVHLTLSIMNLTWLTLRATSIPPSAFLHPLWALILILGIMILMPDSLPTVPPSVDCLDPLASINNLPPIQPSISLTSLPSARIHPSPPRAPFSFPPHAPLFQALGQAISTRANP
ncbi:hypothetical protein IW261DRAFT_1568595 [Armillaria novae-zelandiae]|uniref:Uncharacterized protein n=1 Tax=Armillaria novae-zelandiae TaxID=153914 RepID=A0AA39NZV2_9AGAR|nr:hypothetical protein IW261DRAFT_1568595 [Armillaria novae-zelandiae]